MMSMELILKFNYAIDPIDPAIEARVQRDDLLKDSDYSQLPDAPVDAVAWATYRQALRDVPEQDGFPDTINWPTKPGDE
jgi:hypothetical protein